MYRALTFKALRDEIDIYDVCAIESMAKQTIVRLDSKDGSNVVTLDGEDVTEEIRQPDVTGAVSLVSSYAPVRQAMVQQQREMGKDGGLVLEGRDIGTVVFPQAELKVFMVADLKERARRRKAELEANGIAAEDAIIQKEILERDAKDSQRDLSPLRKAEDAIALDTSEMTIDQQVEFIVERTKDILSKL